MNRLLKRMATANDDYIMKQYFETDEMPQMGALSYFQEAYNILNNYIMNNKTARAILMNLDKNQVIDKEEVGTLYWPEGLEDLIDKQLETVKRKMLLIYPEHKPEIMYLFSNMFKFELVRRLYTKCYRVYQETWPDVRKKIFKSLVKELKTIVPQVTFPHEKNSDLKDNDFYAYSKLDSDKFFRKEALPVLDFIAEHKDIADRIIHNAVNMSLQEFEKIYIPWDQYIDLLKNNSYICDALHLKVRPYIVELNRDVVKEKFNSINELQDKIVSINEDGDIIDENGNIINDKPGISLTLDFDPREDSQREKPIVIIREYKENGNYQNHIVIGRRGANHGSILKAEKYQDLIQKSIKDGNPTIAACYLIGTIAIIDNFRSMFPSIKDVIDALKESGKFTKIYVMRTQSKEKTIYRLAWKKR